MTSPKETCLSFFAAFSCVATPVAAQTFTGTEAPYASVRGWDVISITEQNGAFHSCGAIKTENGNSVMVAHGRDGSWIVSVPTNQTSTFGGGILDIDKASIDSQFGFVGGFAIRDLSPSELQLIKAGNQMGITVNGDGPTKW